MISTCSHPRTFAALSVLMLAACAGTPGPGDDGYAFNASGVYSGRLVVDGQRFESRLDLETFRGGAVEGVFRTGAPVPVSGRAQGRIIGDLLRLTIRYRGEGTTDCDRRIEGILSIEEGGSTIEGPVTVYDCDAAIAGRVSFRR